MKKDYQKRYTPSSKIRKDITQIVGEEKTKKDLEKYND